MTDRAPAGGSAPADVPTDPPGTGSTGDPGAPAAPRTPDPESVSVRAVGALGEVTTSTDLPRTLVDACAAAGVRLESGDVVCVASKVVSKWLGLVADDRDAAVQADTREVVAARRTPAGTTRVVRAAAGPVLAAAGVDESNTGPRGRALRLPTDPDAVARHLRSAVAALAGLQPPPAVVLTDTVGRPWRDGQVDIALGVAGLAPVDDLRGGRDADGRMLSVTVRALADEVAAAADLVTGKVGGVPVAVLRGLARWVAAADGPGAARLLRDPAGDWFGRGDVESVDRALGVPGHPDGPPPAPGVLPGDPVTGLQRAVAVATAAAEPGASCRADPDDPDGAVVVAGDPVAVGRLVERLATAVRALRLGVHAAPVAVGSAGGTAPGPRGRLDAAGRAGDGETVWRVSLARA